jgi:hypothetical protein
MLDRFDFVDFLEGKSTKSARDLLLFLAGAPRRGASEPCKLFPGGC